MSTKIEWTDETWNPGAGCNDVSEGCRNCYARKMAGRLEAMGVEKYKGLTVLQGSHRVWTGKISFDEKALLAPLSRKKPTRYFVNSMSDLFHENVTDEMRDRIFAVMALCPQHTFQVLTKRPERMLAYLENACGRIADLVMKMRAERGDRGCVGPLPHIAPGAAWWPLANVWLGVSVEDQKTADERIPLLLQAPAAVRFLSAEPLLGPIDLMEMKNTVCRFNPLPAGYEKAIAFYLDSLRGCRSCVLENCDAREEEEGSIPRLDWVIVGGESDSGGQRKARPMHPDWARDLRDQCVAAGVPFFFKQWGEWLPWEFDGGYPELKSQNGKLMDRHALPDLKDASVHNWTDACLHDGSDVCVHQRVGKKSAGHLLDGEEWHQFPEVQ